MNSVPNFHTHTGYCDGKGAAETYVLSAIAKNQSAIGFSGHAPVPFESWWNMKEDDFDKYLYEISALKTKYGKEIEIYKAVEADYIQGLVSPADFSQLNLDYVIGSIHYLFPSAAEKPWDFVISPKIFEQGLTEYYQNDITNLVKHYYKASCEMIEDGGFEIIGHCDQIGKFNFDNKYFSPLAAFHTQAIDEMLELIAQKNIIVEINTRGKLKNNSEEFYPTLNILKKCKRMNINIILSADAHTPQETDSFLYEAATVAKNAGYQELMIFKNTTFEQVGIENFC